MRDGEKTQSDHELSSPPSLRPSVSLSSSSPHVIRLREPWERERLEDGRVQCTRRFHRPTGLDANSRVWLAVEGVEGDAEVALNGRVVGRARATRFEITELLRPENVVSIVLSPAQHGNEQQGEFAAVRLEIEEGPA